MATMTESEIRRQVVDYLRMKGYFTFHLLQSLGCYRGAPDLIAVKGKTLFIELKKPGGRQSEYQKQFQADLEAAGGEYILCYGVDDLIERGI